MSLIWDEDPEVEVEILRGSKEWEERVEKVMDKVHHDIEEFGWSAMHIFGDQNNPIMFTYTVGLKETYNHPELIIYGISDSELAHGLLRCAVDLIKDGTRFEDGVRYTDIMQDPYPMEARDHPPGRPLNWATKYYGEEVGAIQLVWPDANGKFPEDEGFEKRYEGYQNQQTWEH